MERTLIILKPDSVKRKLVGEIIRRIEQKDYTIASLKMINISREQAEEHYGHVRAKPFFGSMLDYITSGPVVVLIVEGYRVIEAVRNMIGKTVSVESAPGTIRGDFGSHKYENLIHASDSPDNAEIEIRRFFPELM